MARIIVRSAPCPYMSTVAKSANVNLNICRFPITIPPPNAPRAAIIGSKRCCRQGPYAQRAYHRDQAVLHHLNVHLQEAEAFKSGLSVRRPRFLDTGISSVECQKNISLGSGTQQWKYYLQDFRCPKTEPMMASTAASMLMQPVLTIKS